MEQTVVKSSSPFEVLALAEHTLGFRPQESLVLVSLRPPRWRTGLVARADLADLERPGALEELVGHLRADGAGRCFVAITTDAGAVLSVPRSRASDPRRRQAQDRLERLPAARLARSVGAALLEAGIEPEPWLVHRGRLHSYTCARPCCPPRGLPTSELASTQVAAEMVFAGRVVAPSRPAWEHGLRTSVRPVTGAGAEEVARGLAGAGSGARATPEVALALWCSLTTPQEGHREGQREGQHDGSVRAVPDPAGLGPSAAVTLLRALAAVPLRDVLLGAVAPGALPACSGRSCGPGCVWPPGWSAATCAMSTVERVTDAAAAAPDAATAVRVLQHLARLAPPGLRAVPLGCAAYLLWWSGAAAPAGLHAELALADDPEHSLSHLVLCGVRAGLPSPLVEEGNGGASEW